MCKMFETMAAQAKTAATSKTDTVKFDAAAFEKLRDLAPATKVAKAA